MTGEQSLLASGYLPVQLPPTFDSTSYAANYEALVTGWRNLERPSARLDRFSVARASYHRRITSIPNPVPYLFLVESILQYWEQIQKHYKRSSISLSKPELGGSERAISITRFRELDEQRVLNSAGYRFVLQTDIARYFPTLYTHVIPWAIHGKEVAKRNSRKKTAKYFGNILDDRSMSLQGRQTIGIPIGPDSSHIIAEIVGSAIDVELHRAIKHWPAGFRYVDDYCLFFDDRAKAERALTALGRAFAKFELQINPDKTRIVEVSELVREGWPYELRRLRISERVHDQRIDIHRLFARLHELYRIHLDEAVIKYGLKVVSTQIVKKQNWPVNEAYLMKFGHAFPSSLQTIARIFATYWFYGYPIDREALERFCNSCIQRHAVADGHSEMAWALWLALQLGLSIFPATVSAVIGTGNSVCMLLLLAIEENECTEKPVTRKQLKRYTAGEALKSENWLFVYEAGRRDWLSGGNGIIDEDPHFSLLQQCGVGFFDSKTEVTPLFVLKEDFNEDSFAWDSDDDIAEFFDFEEPDLDYTEFAALSEEDLEVTDDDEF